MSVTIKRLGPLPAELTGAVFDFFSPKEIVWIINRVRKSWATYMPSGILNLNGLLITDHDLSIILSKSKRTYPNKSLTHLALGDCSNLTFKSGKRISEIHTLTHLSLAECIHEGEDDDVVLGLKEMPNLVYLDLSGIFRWEPKVIAQFSSLKTLILKGCCCDEALKALKGLSLEELDVSNNYDMTPACVPYLNAMTSLKAIDISETLIPPEQVKRKDLRIISF